MCHHPNPFHDQFIEMWSMMVLFIPDNIFIIPPVVEMNHVLLYITIFHVVPIIALHPDILIAHVVMYVPLDSK